MEAEAEAEAKQAKVTNQKAELASIKAAIAEKVNNKFIRPAEAVGRLKSTIRVKLRENGEIVSVETINGSGSDLFDKNAEHAVLASSPLPVPQDKELFNKEFRSFTFVFEPK